jgi:tRNA threonylcarbamoyladenosine biosynthesis protein TsaB
MAFKERSHPSKEKSIFYVLVCMALILNIETATEVCSVALADEKGLIGFLENAEGKSHASLLTVLIQDLLKKNKLTLHQLDAVAVSMGPGSYTGLRIGVSVAKGICYGANKPLIAVPTLQSMASGFIRSNCTYNVDTWYCPMIDARRLEVYTAFFDNKAGFKGNISAKIIDENSFANILQQHEVYFFGNGSDKCSPLLKHPSAKFFSGFLASAKDMAPLSENLFQQKEFKDVAYFEPYYLKDFVATIPKNKVLK